VKAIKASCFKLNTMTTVDFITELFCKRPKLSIEAKHIIFSNKAFILHACCKRG